MRAAERLWRARFGGVYDERHLIPWRRRERRDPLADARARLRGYVSPIATLTPEEREKLCA